MAERDGEFGAFFSGFLMGALVGGAVALLMAPLSGDDTRVMIKDKSIELKDKTSLRAEELRQKTKDSASGLQQRGQVVLEENKVSQAEVDIYGYPLDVFPIGEYSLRVTVKEKATQAEVTQEMPFKVTE